MSFCTIDMTIFIIGFVLSIIVPFLLYKFVLSKNIKQKWVSIVISIILFVVLIYITRSVSEVCSGPLIGPGGEILG